MISLGQGPPHPTEPGWYWVRIKGTKPWAVISIDMTPIGLRWVSPSPGKPLEGWWKPLHYLRYDNADIVGPFHEPPTPPTTDDT